MGKRLDVQAAIRKGGTARHSIGDSVSLVVRNGSALWEYQFRENKRTRSVILGSAKGPDAMTITEAREARAQKWIERRNGTLQRKSEAAGERFAKAADAYLSNHAGEWNERHRAGLKALVRKYVPTWFAHKPVSHITSDDVAAVLKANDKNGKGGKPIWNGPGNNRGSRLRRLIEGVLRSRDVEPNPAAWERLRERLSKARAKVVERAAMPAADIPAFLATHAPSDGDIEQRALRFVILTAVRRKEALEAKWNEFDLTERVWRIPASRMKMRRPHAVPLTDAVLACLGERGADDAYVFPSKRTGRVMGHEALKMKDFGFTLHGFRSSFGTWAEEQDDGRTYPMRVIKAALAHGKQNAEDDANAVIARYLRSDQFQARRKLMEHWSQFATGW